MPPNWPAACSVDRMIALLLIASMALPLSAQSAVITRSTKIIESGSLAAKSRAVVAAISAPARTTATVTPDDPILRAIEADRADQVAKWLSRGHSANSRIQSRVKESLLEKAAVSAAVESFKVLLSGLKRERADARQYGRDQWGTPLVLILTTLATPGKKETPRYLQMIDHYLKWNADQVDWKDKAYIGDGRTALHQAASNGNVSLVNLLLSHGAHTDSVNSTGESPLHFAARFGQVSVLKILIEQGARIDQRTKHTLATPLLIAAESGHELIIRELLEHGAKKDVKDAFGKTPPQRYREYVASYQRRSKNRSSN